MKLLLDEMLSPRIAVELRARGRDALAVKEVPALLGAPDELVLAFARQDDRAVVTNNIRDFRRLCADAVAAGGAGHHGLILVPSNLRRTRAATAPLVARLDELLHEHAKSGLAGREVWL